MSTAAQAGEASTYSHPAAGRPGFILPKGLLFLIGFALIWIYSYRISTNELIWEESRRCLVASEMIYRGDYIVPRVLGEPYRNKPPLQNWLIILLAGNSAERIGPLAIRSISLLSILGITGFLIYLRRSQKTKNIFWLPALIFLTMGIVVQYGRFGELDPLFTFWIVAAFCCFEVGRRRRAVWIQWFLSQALLAGGILTKGLAPLFFYPPVIYLVLKDRKKTPFSIKAFLLGLGAESLLVSAWLIPYSSRLSVSSLGKTFTNEILQRTPLHQGAGEFIAHFLFFPFEVLGNTLPWSLLLALGLLPEVRKGLTTLIQQDPLLKLALAISIWAFFIFWLMPGAKGRYLFPVYPFFALLLASTMETGLPVFSGIRLSGLPRRFSRFMNQIFIHKQTGWIFLISLFTISLFIISIAEADSPLAWQPLGVGIIIIAGTGHALRLRKGEGWIFSILLLSALLYAIIFAGVSAVHKAEKEKPLVRDAGQIASLIKKPLPVICEIDVSRGACFYIIKQLNRLVQRRAPKEGAYYIIAGKEKISPAKGLFLGKAGAFHLWEITWEGAIKPKGRDR